LEDARDLRFGAFLAGSEAPASTANLWIAGMKVKHQHENSCCGRALAYALQLAHRSTSKEFSAFDAYYKGRFVMGTQSRDEGCQLRPMFNALQKLGCASESVSPSTDSSRVNLPPTWAAQKSAHKWRGVRRYFSVTGKNMPHEARIALSRGMPVVGGWMVSQRFRKFAGGEVFQHDPEETIIGGHAMCVVGFEKDEFTLVNSWGREWADRGFARVSSNFLEQAMSLWVCDVAV